MIFQRMDAAINYANIDQSNPEQFVLSHSDYGDFYTLQSPHKGTRPITLNYRGIVVVKATEKNAVSLLHVIPSRPIHVNPIRV